ncbi:YfbU family protein [Clostridium manihotivorum]|uniref:YfbU family protein n=1 Tax=Clostridium manihotivorum TaxID=2320868 RepID=A0A410DQL0_9CLOT|nr:YfbU family protein [Clostridium manihotivorum]QAA31315.1 hypothetical protein C1I91_06480 [Clostridium manihotivorum]
MELTRVERIILANQYRILEALYPEDAESYANNRKALEEGFELHYSELFGSLSENELNSEECREVIEILNLYRALTFSYEELEDKSDLDEYAVMFRGFDLNDEYEGKRVIYARYFINDLDRFEELKYGKSYAECNSHSEMMPKYRRMLDKWQKLGKSFELTKDQIISIVK